VKSEASFTSYVDLDVIPGQVIKPISEKLILDKFSPDKPSTGSLIIGKLSPGTIAQSNPGKPFIGPQHR
jgi:hypothetical protein